MLPHSVDLLLFYLHNNVKHLHAAMAATAPKCMPQFLLERITLLACLPAYPLTPISICIYVRRQRNATPSPLLTFLSSTLYVNMQIAARIFCTSLNRTVSCHVHCPQRPNNIPPHSTRCKRCSICNVNWATAVATPAAQGVPCDEIVDFSCAKETLAGKTVKCCREKQAFGSDGTDIFELTLRALCMQIQTFAL